MNFNNPDDVFSSSPATNQTVIETEESYRDDESTVISLDVGGDTRHSNASNDSSSSSGSSARLEAALRQAAAHAGTQGIDFDENGDVSMEMADDDITASFKPWADQDGKKQLAEDLSSRLDQENLFSFSPAAKAAAITGLDRPQGSPDADGVTMDFTTVVGGIQPASPTSGTDARTIRAKRRRSSAVMELDHISGSPRKKVATATTASHRQPSEDDMSFGEESMDMTVAIGAIQSNEIGVRDETISTIDTSFGEIMDFTTIVGGIQGIAELKPSLPDVNQEEDDANDEINDGIHKRFLAV